MTDGGRASSLRYSAFISYSHLDAAFARRLQTRLENYWLPRRLARRDTWREGRARRLRPVFLDRSDLAAVENLTQAVQTAIAESSYLIVVCSPHSVASEWVGREIEFFHGCHGVGGVLAVLVEGAAATALHPSLQWLDKIGKPCQPLAADFGRSGDGDRLALLKLVAVLAGVRLDELVQRDAQRRVQRASIAGMAGVAGMAVMAVLTVAAWQARTRAEREQARGEKVIDFLVNDLRGKLQGVGRLDFLDAVNKAALAYYQGQDLSRLPAGLLEKRAAALQGIGQDEEKRGHFTTSLENFEEAKRSTSALLAEKPSDEDRIRADADSEYWLGFIDWRLGHYDNAHVHYLAFEKAARRLLALSPTKVEWLEEFADAEAALGEFELRHVYDLRAAYEYYERARDAYERVIQAQRGNMDAQDGLLTTDAFRADIKRLEQHYDEAEKIRIDQRSYLETSSGEDERDFRFQAMENSITLALARIDLCRRAWSKAFQELAEAESGARRLAAVDTTNTDAARQVLGTRLFEMEAWLNLPGPERTGQRDAPKVIADCETNNVVHGSAELEAFCSVAKIGYLALNGRDVEAKKEHARLEGSGLLGGNALTERWGLNLEWELATVVGYNKARN
jgi:tetratricopeptide (TPR) repeat protein